MKAVGKTWHKGCLRCTSCSTLLDSKRLNDKDGDPLCGRCYNKVCHALHIASHLTSLYSFMAHKEADMLCLENRAAKLHVSERYPHPMIATLMLNDGS